MILIPLTKWEEHLASGRNFSGPHLPTGQSWPSEEPPGQLDLECQGYPEAS